MGNFAVVDRDRILVPDPDPLVAGLVEEGLLPVAAIRDADPDAAPPEIRTVSGLTVFVSAVQREMLAQFCAATGVPRRRRRDVWADLLEPFVDTEFGDRLQEATALRLGEVGLGPAEVAAIRAQVAPAMSAYNAFHADWCHLGLCDLIDATDADNYRRVATFSGIDPHATPADLPANFPNHTAFLTWAMHIADLGHYEGHAA
ncbi:hypothetical protein [Embleya sp. NPDC050493]|uniref:hypothetical protein n=1 Tax=Embleya sp. NPDC050493 TaxID=3363989 RepID=UPI0037B3E5AB